MAVNWQKIAIALASRLQFEAACGRQRLITEDLSRLFLAEAIQSQISGSVEPEFNHPDLPGDTRVDLLVRSPNAQNIEAAIEHKWVRKTTVATGRNWMAEVLGDAIRVEVLSEDMAGGSERIWVVAGEVEEMKKGIWESESQQGGGLKRVRVVDSLLQARPAAGSNQLQAVTIQLRDIGAPFKRKLRAGTDQLFTSLPTRYSAQLVGYHRALNDGIECAVWKITRPVGQRSTFDASSAWP
jgi:hypothetical protein